MATIVADTIPATRPDRFFFTSAIVMAVVIVSGFSMSLAMGRSTFAVPWYVHAHALLFFGWTSLYTLQAGLATRGGVALHRRLGWLSLLWVPAMVAAGLTVTITSIRILRVPFFFTPVYFLLLDGLGILVFAGLAGAAIVMRRDTGWHRRLMFCAMTFLTGPAIGRLIPMPLLVPYAGLTVIALILLFPLWGALHDLRREGRIHPAWGWGIGTLVLFQLIVEAGSHSGAGIALYDLLAQGSPGASVSPTAFPPPPFH